MSNPTELPDLDRLEALARAATPGEWNAQRHGCVVGGPMRKYVNGSAQAQLASFNVTFHDQDPDDELERQQANAEFCAAANPAAVLALIALARRAQPEGEALTLLKDAARAWNNEAEAELDATMERIECFLLDSRAKPEGEAPQAVISLEVVAAQLYLALNDSYQDGIFVGEDEKTVCAALAAYNRYRSAPAAQHAESGAPADGDELTDDDKRLVARGMERWRKGIAGECRLPPAGWHCTRAPGHEGPCAATPVAAQSQGAQAVLKEIEAALLRARNPMGDRLTHIDAALNATYAALAAQQAAAPDSLNLMNADEMAALRRFDETCQDGEGYDVPKTMMQRLAAIGVVRRTSGSYYETTEFGLRVLDQPAPSAPGTPEAPKKPAHGHRDDYLLMANARRIAARRFSITPNWAFAAELFATGSNSAHQICIGAGIDPDGHKVERAAQLDGGQGQGDEA
jgi:hypothetical protein